MRYVAGIDGGQSSTAAVIVDERGRVVARGGAGPAAHVDEPPGSTRFADACACALARALDAAGLARDTSFEAVHVGLSGWDERFDGARPAFAARTVRVQHDAPVALAGAVQTRPAVVVIAGTGSVAYGEDGHGLAVRVGGWGFLFGDAGSGFAVARDALAHAMAQDDRGVRSPLGDAALAYFDRRTLREVGSAAILGRIPRGELASFARVVHDAARLGDPDAAAIVAEAASALAALAALAIARLALGDAPVPVALAGGAFANDAFVARTRERLGVLVPGAQAVRARYDPATGAALLAFADAGLPVPERISRMTGSPGAAEAALLDRLRGRLIVSVQAEAGSPLGAPEAIALLGRVAVANGAAALRAEGGARIGALRRAVGVPIVGIVKRRYAGYEPYITASLREVAEVTAAGAEIVAFDATARARPGGLDVAGLVAAIRARGALPMADCADPADVRRAAAAGAALVATTLCGYTEPTRGTALPALGLVRACAASGAFAVCEGGVAAPADLRAAFAAGAQAVVVGTAITNVDVLCRRFAAATPAAPA